MTAHQIEYLNLLLDEFMSTTNDKMDEFFIERWTPFLDSLSSQGDREASSIALWKRQINALDNIAQAIPNLSDAEFKHLKPGLDALALLEEPLRTVPTNALAA